MQKESTTQPHQTFLSLPAIDLPQSLSQVQTYMVSNIISIVNNIQVQQSQQKMQDLYETGPKQFMHFLFLIVSKCQGKAGNRGGLAQAVLLYMRHFINKQQHRMPDILKLLIQMYEYLANTQYRSLPIQIMRTFLQKPTHTPYTRDYLQQISLSLLQNLQTNTLTQPNLFLIIQTLQNLQQSKEYRPGLAAESERIIASIVSQYSMKKPAAIKMDVWIWAILVLVGYSRYIIGMEFVSKAIREQNLGAKVRVKVAQTFNRISNKYSNLQQLYHLIQVQLARLTNKTYLSQIEQVAGVQGIQAQLKMVLLMLKTIARCLVSDATTVDINQHMLMQYFRESQFFVKLVTAGLVVMEGYGEESAEFGFMVTQIIEEMSYLLDQQVLASYITQISQTLKQQHLLILLSGLPRSILQLFNCSQILLSHISNLISNKNIMSLSNTKQMYFIQLVLDLLVHYLDVYHFIDGDVQAGICRLLEEYVLGFEDCGKNGLVVRAYGVAIMGRMEKYRGSSGNVYDQVTNIFSMAYDLIQRISTLEQHQQQILTILMDGLSFLRHLKTHQKIVYQRLISFFNHHVLCQQLKQLSLSVQKNKTQREYLYTHFLKLLQYFHESLQESCGVYSVDGALYPVLKYCLETGNRALQDQTCQFVLRILFVANSAYARDKLEKDQFEGIYGSLYNTGIYQYIEKCFKKQDEDYLYCKILMETLYNLDGRKLVQKLLSSVCLSHPINTATHNYDKIWQALVILQGIRNEYTQKHEINSKIDQIMGGSIEALFMSMSLDEQKIFKKQTKNTNNRINWSWLPETRKIIEPGSAIGYVVEEKLNNGIANNY